jgi:hypothetical protein
MSQLCDYSVNSLDIKIHNNHLGTGSNDYGIRGKLHPMFSNKCLHVIYIEVCYKKTNFFHESSSFFYFTYVDHFHPIITNLLISKKWRGRGLVKGIIIFFYQVIRVYDLYI